MESDFLSYLLISVLSLVLVLPFVAGGWRMFVKAGAPGWAYLVPFYNIYVLLKIINRPGWWLALLLIPIVQIVIQFIVALDMAKAFQKNIFFAILLLWLLAPIGYLILGFDDSKYVGEFVPPTPNQKPSQDSAQSGQVQQQTNQTAPTQQAPSQTQAPQKSSIS